MWSMCPESRWSLAGASDSECFIGCNQVLARAAFLSGLVSRAVCFPLTREAVGESQILASYWPEILVFWLSTVQFTTWHLGSSQCMSKRARERGHKQDGSHSCLNLLLLLENRHKEAIVFLSSEPITFATACSLESSQYVEKQGAQLAQGCDYHGNIGSNYTSCLSQCIRIFFSQTDLSFHMILKEVLDHPSTPPLLHAKFKKQFGGKGTKMEVWTKEEIFF